MQISLVGQLTIGIIVTAISRCIIRSTTTCFLKSALEVKPPPNAANPEKWNELIQESGQPGTVLGILELITFFTAVWFGDQAPLVIAGWLAFKVGSKWQVWSGIVGVPQTKLCSEDKVSELDFLIFRRRWGSRRLMTFLIGTLGNIVAAVLGVAAGKYGSILIDSLKQPLIR